MVVSVTGSRFLNAHLPSLPFAAVPRCCAAPHGRSPTPLNHFAELGHDDERRPEAVPAE